ASQRLRISQSALSKAVQLLETSGQVRLFERSKFGVTLTPVGREVFAKCETLFATFGEIETICLQRTDSCEGPLKIGASDHVAKYLLVETLRDLKTKFPNLEPKLFTAGPNEIVSAIVGNEIEFGLFFTRVTHPQIHYEVVNSFPMVVVCHPALKPPAGWVSPRELKSFVRGVGLITSTRSRYSYNPSEAALEQLGESPVNFEINSQEAQKQMCLAKGGVVVLARFMLEDELKRGELKELRIRNPIALDLHLAHRRAHGLSLNAGVTVEALRSRFVR
ncbi:MAG: LysR family transcriptional regulator, partial [Bdellovibrionota bacterium]